MKTAYFILINCCCLAVASCDAQKLPTAANIPVQCALNKAQSAAKYRMWISLKGKEISGIMAVKYVDNAWRGSMINEFGVKAFDFIAAEEGKCRLLNTVSFLDKWYIRKTVESDLAAILWRLPVKGKHFETTGSGQCRLVNEKRKIEYLFQQIEP
ncbi:MAG: hypothetical protein LBB73_08015 [Dysgonamonadaceae bacterium]|nr:hypothetical protein [Dysgonamonadaceae bacterium]